MEPAAATDRWTLYVPDGAIRQANEDLLDRWRADDVPTRLWDADPELWNPPDERTREQIGNRLGWLDLPDRTARSRRLDPIQTIGRRAREADIDRVVLLGMGGSSLGAEVLSNVLGAAQGYPRLHVVDTTHPDAVHRIAQETDPGRTWFLVASKSGTTSETRSLLELFWARAQDEIAEPGKHFIATTDPGTPLAELAAQRSFRSVFFAPKDVGGRYSALSEFGMVPAALIGRDVSTLLQRGREMAMRCGPEVSVTENPALRLGAALGALHANGRTKLTFFTSHSLASFPAWCEQLIAESLGKDDRGIIPVAGELPAPPEAYRDDRVFVSLLLAGEDPALSQEAAAGLVSAGHPYMRIILPDRFAIAEEMLRWEIAVATAGMAIGVNPFDQPNVELAKELARRAMGEDTGAEGGVPDGVPVVDVEREDPETAARRLGEWLDGGSPEALVAIQAFLAPTSGTSSAARRFRTAVRNRGQRATTFGWGPRFLHSTGQLHKGGPPSVRAIQLVDDPRRALPIPGTGDSFRALIAAQADGDLSALVERGRAVIRIRLGADPIPALDGIAEALAAHE